MKKIFSLLLVFTLLLCPVFAVGDANLDGGGGNMGDGTRENQWISGDDGIRVSIMENKTTVCTFDLSNKDWSGMVEYHFGYEREIEKIVDRIEGDMSG